jgi:hypothetical protein
VATFVNFTLLTSRIRRPPLAFGPPHPGATNAAALKPTVEQERPPFRTFGAAVHDLFINLANPRVGAQWLGVARATRQELARQRLN